MDETGVSKILKFKNNTYERANATIPGGPQITNLNFDVIGTGTALLNLFFAR